MSAKAKQIHIPAKVYQRAKNFIVFEAYAYIHELGESTHSELHQKMEVIYEQKVRFFLDKKCADEGYVDGMTAEGLWSTKGSQKFDGKKIWDKAVAVRREIIQKMIPAWNRQLKDRDRLTLSCIPRTDYF